MFRRILFASVGAMALTRAAYAAEPLPPPPPAPPPMWTGFYAGVNAGGSWLSNADTNLSTINVFDDKVRHTDGEGQASAISQSGVVPAGIAAGVIGGGQIGYNYQFAASWLAGIEADIQYLGVRGNGAFTRFGFEPTVFSDAFPDEGAQSTVRSERSADWLGTVRGRLGWLVTPTFLVFGDGGFAYGGVSSNTSVQSLWQFQGSSATLVEQWVPGYGGVSTTRGGWTAGGVPARLEPQGRIPLL